MYLLQGCQVLIHLYNFKLVKYFLDELYHSMTGKFSHNIEAHSTYSAIKGVVITALNDSPAILVRINILYILHNTTLVNFDVAHGIVEV